MKLICSICGEETIKRICVWRVPDDDIFELTELTAADELAFARYQERADFDYWHRGEK